MPILKEYELVDLTEKHKDLILYWRNSDHVRKYMFTDRLITPEEHDRWFGRVQYFDATQDKDLRNVLIQNGIIARILLFQNRPVGFVNFTNIDVRNNKCCWGFYLGERNAPKGSGVWRAMAMPRQIMIP